MKKYLIIALLIVMSACQLGESPQNDNMRPFVEKLESTYPHKKVIMIVIDSMMGSLVDNSIEEGNVPALQFLIKNGQYYKQVVAPFPTMSVTTESTLMTGEMPNKHKVVGLSWYDHKQDRLVNYGTSPEFWAKNGVQQGMYDALYNLNNVHLSKDVSTIYEDLQKHDLSTGAINTLIYRGTKDHQLQLPQLTDEVTVLPDSIDIKGPDVLALGRLAKPEVLKGGSFSDGIFKKFGFNDQYSMEVTQALIRQGDQPDFLMVYLPDFDKMVHRQSPHYRKGFEQLDQYLQGVLNTYESWEDALKENIFIVLGDHGQDKMVSSKEDVGIDLNRLYSDFHIQPLGGSPREGDIAFGVNQRMTYVYDVNDLGLLPRLAYRSKKDQRIALAAWLEGEWVKVISTDQNDSFRFKPNGDWEDRYDQKWTLEGNENIVHLKLNHKQKRISYDVYPDVMNQLYSALKSNQIPSLVLAAKPGYTFESEGIVTYPNGGDHGGIHRNDTLAAMVISGTDKVPEKLRFVDLKEYILTLMTETPEQKKAKSLEQQGHQSSKTLQQTEQNATQLVESINGVTKAVTIVKDEDIYVALQVRRWHRFRLNAIRKQAQGRLSNRFNNKKIHVSSDWKIMRELKNLSKEIRHKEIKSDQLKRKLKKLEKSMRG